MPIHENPVVLSVPGQGLPVGTRIRSFVLRDETSCPDMACQVMTLGATLTHLWVPDSQAQQRDVVVGFDDLTAYRTLHDPYFGASVGRVANRIGNGEFSLPGDPTTVYTLDKNNGPHSLHGGVAGLSYKNWEVVSDGHDNNDPDKEEQRKGTSITFRVVSEHLDQGFPGRLTVECTYTLVDRALEIVYRARLMEEEEEKEGRRTGSGSSIEEAIVSLTNHAYFNLDGVPPPPSPPRPVSSASSDSSGIPKATTIAMSATCLNHWLQLENVDHYLETDATSLPTGVLVPLADQPTMDFRIAKRIGQDLRHVPLVEHCRGYDHFFVSKAYNSNNSNDSNGNENDNDNLTVLAKISSPDSHIRLTVSTTEPGFQLYTANWVHVPPALIDTHTTTTTITTTTGKAAAGYGAHVGFCIEASRFPDAVHHLAWLPQVLLRRGGQQYRARTRFEFGIDG
ncbi:hypothetical protein DFQ26_007849 [Actinomortierella ambigua]|nr:hypothetical protein DFQ26_007849 [Actinomortierella ambigua]